MSSVYAALIVRLAPDHDPAHVEAWMRLEHSTLDGLNPVRFAREVAVAVECIRTAGITESDKLAHSYGLQPRYTAGDHVLVSQEGGLEPAEADITRLEPAEADITRENEHRPHLVKVKYRSRRGAGCWIARGRIIARVITDETPTRGAV